MLTDTPPYGPTDRVIAVLEKYRETGLGGGPFDTPLLERLGMGPEVARRVVLSLKILDLIDDDGMPTDQMVALKQASPEDYKAQLRSLILDQYKSVFAITGHDLNTASSNEIETAFRKFRPDSLRKRQMNLFLGLCAYVGLIDSSVRERPGPKAGTAARRPAVPTAPRTGRRKLASHLKPPPPPPPPNNGATAKAELESGGTVTLNVSVDVVDLSPADRNFVFELIDKVKGYRNQPALPRGRDEDVS